MNRIIRHWVQSLVVLALLLAGSGPAFAAVCDVDNDGDVDRVDINLIFAARNQPATGPDDPRDADGNGTINVLDGRKCTLQCTLANCASPTPNTPPNANAGPDQTGQVGSTITLNGAASSDADGDPLSFAWSFVQRPASSAAVLDNPTAVSPRFVIDESGDYRIQLIVNDGKVNSVPDEVLVTTQNSAPVANAGPDQGLTVGATVTLNGAGSSDPDGDPLTFAWTFNSKPAGSAAVLSNPALVNPQFVADLPGSYVVDLVVNDGSVDSAPDQVVISSGNTAPVANAGPDQTVAVGAAVALNGAGSSDAEGQPLSYAWSLTSKPSGSAAVLSNPNAVNPAFTVDLPGTYVAQLVVNDGFVNSLPDTVQISTSNTAPVADAGPDQTVAAGATVQLNGAGSTDADGNPLTYQWSFTARPAGSGATLSSPTAVNPTFTADLPGDYFLQLVVNDGIVNSSPDTVRISTTNTAPVANAGPDQTVVAGANVQLNGAGSTDVDGNPITYQWSFTSRPPGSNAALSSATVVNPTFTADVLGDYFLQLVVNDGFVNSLPDTVQISTTNSAPVANAGPDQTVPIGSTVQLDGAASSDADNHALTYAWSLTTKPTGSTATLSATNITNPSFVADLPGMYVAQLTVNDGFVDSPVDTVQVSTINSVPVANAGPDQSVLPGAVVTLDGSGSSDADGESLSYQWAILSAPAGSTAALSDPTARNPTLGSTALPLLVGTYVLQLIVNDGHVDSTPDTMTIQVGGSVSLSLIGTQVVGVTRDATVRATLPQPAPAGGVTVTVTSDNAGILTVTAPGTVAIPEGQTSGDVTVHGIAPGTAGLRGNATGYGEGVLDVTVTLNLISMPTTLNVPLGRTANLPVTIAPDPAPAGGVVVSVVSGNPARVRVDTPTVTIPAGQLSANATVFGAGVGGATVNGSNPNYAADVTSATTTATINIVEGNQTINRTFGGQITLQLESPAGTPLAAPAGGVQATLTAANPACLAAASPVTIGQGLTTATSAISYGGTATLPCTSALTVSGAAGITGDSINVTVNPAPGITLSGLPETVGSGLMGSAANTAILGASNHGGVLVRIESSNPAVALVSPDGTTGGTAFFETFVTNGSTNVNFRVHGVEGVTGGVTITASAPGFSNGTGTATIAQPALRLVGLVTTTTALSANDDFQVQVGLPNATNTNLSVVQPLRPGGPGAVATVSNSQAGVAQLTTNAGSDQTRLVGIAAGQNGSPSGLVSGGVQFDPLAAGSTTVAAGIPGFIATAAASQAVTVTGAGITLSGLPDAAGSGLMSNTVNTAILGASNHGGVLVRIESSNPAVALVSPDGTTVGTAFFETFVADGATTVPFRVHGVEGVTGSVTITASAPGFSNGTGTATIAQPALRLVGLVTTTTALSANDDFQVQVGLPNATNTNLSVVQPLRPGSPGLIATVSNSQAGVAQLTTNAGSDQTRLVGIAAGQNGSPSGLVSGGVQFDPLAAGSTTVAAGIPGFIATAAASQTVTVTGAGITMSGLPETVGSGLMGSAGNTAILGASSHGGVLVRIESSNPAVALVSPDGATVGTAFFETFVADGFTNVNFRVHGVEGATGSVTITASATGFSNGTGTATIAQPALRLVGLVTTTTALSANDDFQVQVGLPNATNTNLSAVQPLRPGSPGLIATVSNSQAGVAQLTTNAGSDQTRLVAIAAGQNASPSGLVSGGVQFDPLTTGTTTVAADIPGFVATAAASQNVTVNTPGITMSGLPEAVGSGLMGSDGDGAILGASDHGGVLVRIESSNPAVALVSPNASTPGEAFFETFVADGATTVNFRVHGVEGATGGVTITASAPGFTNGTGGATIAQPALRLVSLATSTTAAAANDDFQVQVGLPNATNTTLSVVQPVRAGSLGLSVTVSNSHAGVAQLTTNAGSDQVRLVTIAAGQNASPSGLAAGGVQFDPLAAGTTVVDASIVGFSTTNAGSVTVSVTP